MTITKSIVDAMGGSIRVESRPGQGSDFYVTLDMEKIPAQAQEMTLPRRTVLLVDDDELSCKTAENMLCSLGLQAEWVGNLEDAFRRMEKCGEGEEFPIVLLDWDIQDRDGIEAAGELRDRFGEKFTLLLLSDGEWDNLEVQARAAGIDGFVEKPLFRSGLYFGLRPFAEAQGHGAGEEETDGMDFVGRRILFAEDNELNWEIGESMLSELGLELDWAEDGKICLEKFEQSEEGWYDLIMMDLRMPVMSGYEAASAIRSLSRKDAEAIPIIAVSADAFEDDVKKCLACGMNAHAAKPYDMVELAGLLERYLHGQGEG